MAPHEHRWKATMHLDGCHWYSTGAACTCGATLSVTHERSPAADPYSMIWMEPQYREVTRDERGRFVKPHWEEVVCDRCRELQAGAPARSDLAVVLKDGTVEREEHLEHEQKEEEAEDEEDA
jgi:hypothetical protein